MLRCDEHTVCRRLGWRHSSRDDLEWTSTLRKSRTVCVLRVNAVLRHEQECYPWTGRAMGHAFGCLAADCSSAVPVEGVGLRRRLCYTTWLVQPSLGSIWSSQRALAWGQSRLLFGARPFSGRHPDLHWPFHKNHRLRASGLVQPAILKRLARTVSRGCDGWCSGGPGPCCILHHKRSLTRWASTPPTRDRGCSNCPVIPQASAATAPNRACTSGRCVRCGLARP